MRRPDFPSVPFSGGSVDAVEAYEKALDRFLAGSFDPLAALEPALAAEPGFAAGHLLVAGLAVAAWDKRSFAALRRSLAAMLPLAGSANARERAHFDAARAWLAGEHAKAAEQYAAIVREWPGDTLALRLTQAAYVFIGRSRRTPAGRRAGARVVAAGHEGLRARPRDARLRARRERRGRAGGGSLGRRALDLRPRHPFAIHAVAHALARPGPRRRGREVAGRARRRLGGRRRACAAPRLARRPLPARARADRPRARDLRRAGAARRTRASDAGDAAALLWRLHLEGVDVADRWRPVADLWADRAGDAFWPLLDVHAMMAFGAAGRDAEAAALLLG